jgi:hypothetical protein
LRSNKEESLDVKGTEHKAEDHPCKGALCTTSENVHGRDRHFLERPQIVPMMVEAAKVGVPP